MMMSVQGAPNINILLLVSALLVAPHNCAVGTTSVHVVFGNHLVCVLVTLNEHSMVQRLWRPYVVATRNHTVMHLQDIGKNASKDPGRPVVSKQLLIWSRPADSQPLCLQSWKRLKLQVHMYRAAGSASRAQHQVLVVLSCYRV